MVPSAKVAALNAAYDKLFAEKPSSNPSETPDGPKTGVASALPFVLVLGAASAAAAVVSRRRAK